MSREPLLVLGATGFIGRALLRRAAAQGVPVSVLGFAHRGQAGRLAGLAGVDVVLSDDASGEAVARAIGGRRFAAVVNLVAGGVAPGQRSPEHMIEAGPMLLARLLPALADNPPDLFVQAGSFSEYAPGAPQVPLREDDSLHTPSVYGAAKAAASLFGAALAGRLGIPFCVARLFHVYGPGESAHRLIPALRRALLDGHPVDLTDGLQVRDFLHVDDVADALLALAGHAAGAAGQTFNVCSGEGVAVRQVALWVAEMLDASPDLLRFGALPARDDEARWIVGDNARLHALTGWCPRIGLRRGIADLLHDASISA